MCVQPALAERLGEFAAAVGAVVEKEDGVPGTDAALRIEDVRKEELVGRSGGVGGLKCFAAGLGPSGTGSVHEGVVGNFHAFPTGVAVHGVVAAGQ